jgi:hypothetical protein
MVGAEGTAPAQTPPAKEQQAIDNLKAQLSQLLEIEPKRILRSELGVDFCFDRAAYHVTRIRELCEALQASDLGNLWDEKLVRLAQQVGNIRTTFQDIIRYDAKQPNANQTRDVHLESVRGGYSGLCDLVIPVLPFAILKKTNVEKIESDFREALSRALRESSATNNTLKSALGEAETTLEKLRTVSGEIGIAKYAGIFGSEANEQSRQSWYWAVGAGLLTIVATVYTFLFFEPHIRSLFESPKPVPSGMLIPLTLSRVVLISLLYMGVVWCIRNFSAARHNSIVNRHRHNALSTFEAFVRAAEGDVQTKNAVLLQATQSIFAPQPSGYLKSDNDAPSGAPVIEIVRTLAGKHE